MAENRLRYVPSFHYSEGFSKYEQLTKKYQHLFLDFIRTGKFSDKESFFVAIEHVSEYIASSVEHFLTREPYEQKNQRDKITTSIYQRIKAIHKENILDTMRDDFFFLAQESVYVALGISRYKNRNYLWNPDKHGNFIRYAMHYVFRDLLKEFFEKETVKYSVSFYDPECVLGKNEESGESIALNDAEIEKAIERSSFAGKISGEMKEAIKSIILGLSEETKQLAPYVRIVRKELANV